MNIEITLEESTMLYWALRDKMWKCLQDGSKDEAKCFEELANKINHLEYRLEKERYKGFEIRFNHGFESYYIRRLRDNWVFLERFAKRDEAREWLDCLIEDENNDERAGNES